MLAQYSARQAAWNRLMKELSPQETLQRVNGFLISVGDVVGNMLNELIKVTAGLDPTKIAHGRGMMEQAGLQGVVDFRHGDARDTISGFDGRFDFVLVDLWKDLYVPCCDPFYPKLDPGAPIAADNMIEPAASTNGELPPHRVKER